MRVRLLLSILTLILTAGCSSTSSPTDDASPQTDGSALADHTDTPMDWPSPGTDGGTRPQDLDTLAYGTDGTGIGGAWGTPFVFDVASRYASDAAFRAMIANYGQTPGNPLVASFDPSKAGTGDRATALYIDGVNPDLADWVPGVGPGGDPAFVLTVKALNQPSESPTPQLATSAQHHHSVWLWVRRRYDPGFSSYGDADDTNGALTWNRTQGAGLKIGPYASYGYFDAEANAMYYGRAGLQTGNGQADSTADYDLVNLPQGTPQPAGINDTRIGDVTTEWTDGLWRDYLVFVGSSRETDGTIHVAAAAWTRTLGGGPYVQIGTELHGLIGPITNFQRPTFDEIEPFMLNANLARRTDEHFRVWGWAAFDADVEFNPFGVLAH